MFNTAGIIGHPTVTERAYAQDRGKREEASRFAFCVVHNGLGEAIRKLDESDIFRLRAQIERDYLASMLSKGG